MREKSQNPSGHRLRKSLPQNPSMCYVLLPLAEAHPELSRVLGTATLILARLPT